jgi:hypothetical protein
VVVRSQSEEVLPSSDVKFNLSSDLALKVATFGESSYGATTATLVLRDGTRIPHVRIAWGRHVIRTDDIQREKRLATLSPVDVVDVLPEP